MESRLQLDGKNHKPDRVSDASLPGGRTCLRHLQPAAVHLGDASLSQLAPHRIATFPAGILQWPLAVPHNLPDAVRSGRQRVLHISLHAIGAALC